MLDIKEFKPGVPDYSTAHEPIGKHFPRNLDKTVLEGQKLSQEQIDQFWEDGYLLNIPVLTSEQCDLILEEYKYFMGGAQHPGMEMLYEYHSNQSGDPDNVLMHALGHWRLTEGFHDIVFFPKIVVPVSQLLEQDGSMSSVRFWHDQLFAKPPNHGGCVACEYDWIMHISAHTLIGTYSPGGPNIGEWCLTLHSWFSQVEKTVDNEEIAYNKQFLHYPKCVPKPFFMEESKSSLFENGWTRNGAPLPVTDFNFKDMESIKTILTEEEKANFKPVCGNLKKGEASFHHALAVHGSYGNRSDKPRRAAVLNYFQDGVKSDTDEPQLKGIIINKGEKMGGQFFPLVFDKAWMQ